MPNLTPDQLEEEMERARVQFERWRQVHRRPHRVHWQEREDQRNDPRDEARVTMPSEEEQYE